MDNDKQKSTENNSSARPGIFSTPDLTVDTEKLAQATPSADANKARIASVFANTDATRQAQQSAITSAPLEGDVIINNVPKKRRKWPIIVLAVAAVSIIALAVGLAITSQTSTQSPSAKSAFQEYYKLLTDGPDGYDGERPNGWFLYALQDNDMLGYAEKLDYANKLLHYADLANQKNDITAYNIDLQTIVYTILPEVFSQKILERYSSSGAQSALQFVNAIRNENDDPSSALGAFNSSFNRYALAQLDFYDFYDGFGCIKNGAIDTDCAEQHEDNPSWYQLRKNESTRYNYVLRLLAQAEEEFAKQTNEASNTIGGRDE